MGKKRRSHASGKITASLRRRSVLLEVAEDVGITTLIAWLFYSSPIAGLFFPAVCYGNRRRLKDQEEKQRANRFYEEYRELLSAVSAALSNGLSVENGFCEAERTLAMLYGEDSVIQEDLHALNHKVKVRVPIEQAFMEFAERYPYEEVRDFAQIFRFGKRMGGNYLTNLRRSVAKMEESIEVRREIATNLAEKQLELRIMTVMPVGILGYIRMGSPGFMEPLYHNVFGYGVMSACLVVYAICIFVGKRIVEIEV